MDNDDMRESNSSASSRLEKPQGTTTHVPLAQEINVLLNVRLTKG
jgi:hypothetical protein